MALLRDGLKRPFSDGTTHVKFTPEDFMARLAALVPRPRANLTRYHGVFAPARTPWTPTKKTSLIQMLVDSCGPVNALSPSAV